MFPVQLEMNVSINCNNTIKKFLCMGRYVTVVATEDGDALNMISDAIDIDHDISINTQVSNDQVQTLIKEYAKNNWGVLYDDISIPELSGR